MTRFELFEKLRKDIEIKESKIKAYGYEIEKYKRQLSKLINKDNMFKAYNAYSGDETAFTEEEREEIKKWLSDYIDKKVEKVRNKIKLLEIEIRNTKLQFK